MEESHINSFEELIKSLRKYFFLNRNPNLSPQERQAKQKAELDIIHFLNDIQTVATYENPKKADYSIETINKYFDFGCVPFLSKSEEAELFNRKSFVDVLENMMKEKGVKSKKVIEATGLNQSVFSKVKIGLRQPSKEVLEALSNYFHYDFKQHL